MQTLKIAPNVYVDFRRIGSEIEIVRVYRKNGIGFNGDYTFTDPNAAQWAATMIRMQK